jgi:hypothetical protein
LLEQMDWTEHLEQQAHKDQQVTTVQQDRKDRQVMMELMAQLDLKVRKV